MDGQTCRTRMSVKICVVGCGALGSVIAAHLARLDDVEVYAYDVSREHVRAIQVRGLQISGVADFTVKLHATSEAKEIPACDFGIFAAKSLHTRAAVEQTAHIFGTSGAVCSVQNGLGNEEIIAEQVRYVIRGATTMAAHMRGPGHAGLEFYSNLWIGPFEPSGTPFERVQQLADLLNRSGLRVVPLQPVARSGPSLFSIPQSIPWVRLPGFITAPLIAFRQPPCCTRPCCKKESQ